MLPSGNDAAFLLAEYFGSILRTKKYFSCDLSRKNSNLNSTEPTNPNKVNLSQSKFIDHPTIKFFLKEMNDNAYRLGMVDT